MDQLGNTGRITEEQGSGSTGSQQAEGPAGKAAGGADVPCSLAVYRADLASASTSAAGSGAFDAGVPASGSTSTVSSGSGCEASDALSGSGSSAADASSGSGSSALDGVYPDGFTGVLALQNLESFDGSMTGAALSRVGHLVSWAQAQQARLLHRMEDIFRDSIEAASGRVEPGLAFSLAAAECGAILNLPHRTAERLMDEAGILCSTHTATLHGLEEGRLSYQHAQVVLDQCQGVPAAGLPGIETEMLTAAEGQTRAQFAVRARRLREQQYPQTLSVRHRSAFEKRRVSLDREEDGMSCLSAYLLAAEAQQIFTALSTAARGEQAVGDPRTADQLRADLLAQLLMGSLGSARTGDSGAGTGGGVRGTGGAGADGTGETGPRSDGRGGVEDAAEVVPRAEIMVLINAETLFGADDRPAELHGYGPISAEAARRLARSAAGWTGLALNPGTGEILGVGRRRKVPAGLRRWLRARDGTCRFPGCRVGTAVSEIDHTTDWARGGATDHGNLEHLCRRHHRFKTLGYWKACQPEPGVIEWVSPTGRAYRTDPHLNLGPPDAPPLREPRDGELPDQDPRDGESPDQEPVDKERRDTQFPDVEPPDCEAPEEPLPPF